MIEPSLCYLVVLVVYKQRSKEVFTDAHSRLGSPTLCDARFFSWCLAFMLIIFFPYVRVLRLGTQRRAEYHTCTLLESAIHASSLPVVDPKYS